MIKQLFLLMLLAAVPQLALAATMAGNIGEKVGTIVKLSKDKSETRLAAGADIFVGDVLQTKDNAKAKLVLNDGSVLSLGANTRMKITSALFKPKEKERSSSMFLFMGKVKALVSKFLGASNNFEIRSSTAVAGVRGTEFVFEQIVIDGEKPRSVVTVIEGSVAVHNPSDKNQRKVVLLANQQTNVKKGFTPSDAKQLTGEQVQGLVVGTNISAGEVQTGQSESGLITEQDFSDSGDQNGNGDQAEGDGDGEGADDEIDFGDPLGIDGSPIDGIGDLIDIDVDQTPARTRTRIKVDF